MSPVGDRARRLEARVAKKSFRTASGQSVPVIADLSFALEDGETGALIGPSGCGKSTLMRILAGLDRDFEGSVHMPDAWPGRHGLSGAAAPAVAQRRGQCAARRAGSERSRGRALCSPRSASPSTARIFPANSRSASRAARRWRARSRSSPTLLLLDEPFVSLDAPLARQLQGDLARLVESRGMITVLVTHDVDEAIALADRIFVLSARPAHVVGEIRVQSPRAAMNDGEARALAAQIEALRGPG